MPLGESKHTFKHAPPLLPLVLLITASATLLIEAQTRPPHTTDANTINSTEQKTN